MIRQRTLKENSPPENPILMENVVNPDEIALAQAQRKQFDRNWDWFQVHTSEVFSGYRGKYICIAGQQLFAADSAGEAIRLAEIVHPDDKGRFVHYVPREKLERIYANRRILG